MVDKCFYAGPARIDYDDVCHEKQDANAHLIAAAPDLLAACREALALLHKHVPAKTTAVREQLAAAIQKAEPNA